ncbi:molybdate ABC transporter substrate-binding protein [Heliobacillus mobilis]|uniref:Molybdate ABC transporter substrate-binding protein n=2 Tax=Heliobacterium mobile TaxID=28064 RepID=A0A6I3SJW4_HELMO|nr:molybdate ABC transporter substrate-binding protein [Heliobacterium mobile]
MMLMSAIAIVLLAGCAPSVPTSGTTTSPSAQPSTVKSNSVLFAYVGTGIKEPVTELAQMYEAKTGTKVEMTFNSSGALLSQVETAKKGDIYLPGGMPYVEKAKNAGHVSETVGPIAYHVPVIMTPKGNPAQIKSLKDLTRSNVKLILPDTEATAIGKSALHIFEKAEISKDVLKNVQAYVETAPKVLTTLQLGQGNAAIGEYSAAVKAKDMVDLIEIDPQFNEVEQIPCAVLTYSNQQTEATNFLDFMAKEGPKVFEKYGFKTRLDTP